MYYCNKCNSIPLLFIIPNLNGSEVLKECLCGKEKLDIVNITKKKMKVILLNIFLKMEN